MCSACTCRRRKGKSGCTSSTWSSWLGLTWRDARTWTRCTGTGDTATRSHPPSGDTPSLAKTTGAVPMDLGPAVAPSAQTAGDARHLAARKWSSMADIISAGRGRRICTFVIQFAIPETLGECFFFNFLLGNSNEMVFFFVMFLNSHLGIYLGTDLHNINLNFYTLRLFNKDYLKYVLFTNYWKRSAKPRKWLKYFSLLVCYK